MVAVLATLTLTAVSFWLLAGLAVVTALLVVVHRNPVMSGLFLVLNLISVAGLFVLLGAYFLAALQILLYAGAIVVLIIFVIMLLNLETERRSTPGLISMVTAFGLGTLLVGALARAGGSFEPHSYTSGPPVPGYGSAASVGEALFSVYFYPFEVVSLALVAAMVGAVLLAKRTLED